jgi:hypothetical protein
MSLDEFSFEILICVGHFRVFLEVITKKEVSVPPLTGNLNHVKVVCDSPNRFPEVATVRNTLFELGSVDPPKCLEWFDTSVRVFERLNSYHDVDDRFGSETRNRRAPDMLYRFNMFPNGVSNLSSLFLVFVHPFRVVAD